MTNWFYMNRITFASLLHDELGENLTQQLLSLDFDSPISFMIGETSDQILIKIQQTFSRQICRKIICNDHCISCSFNPPIYAKLTWFVQRLLIMSPLSKPFVKQISLLNEDSICIKEKTMAGTCNLNGENQNDLSDIYQIKNNTTKINQTDYFNYKVLSIILILLNIIMALFVLC